MQRVLLMQIVSADAVATEEIAAIARKKYPIPISSEMIVETEMLTAAKTKLRNSIAEPVAPALSGRMVERKERVEGMITDCPNPIMQCVINTADRGLPPWRLNPKPTVPKGHTQLTSNVAIIIPCGEWENLAADQSLRLPPTSAPSSIAAPTGKNVTPSIPGDRLYGAFARDKGRRVREVSMHANVEASVA